MATNKNKLTAILMAFFQVVRLLLEILFISTDPRPETFSGNHESRKHSRSSDGDEKKEEEHFSNSSDNQAALEASFKYFEIDNPKEATREAVKKKFRRLSLVHHPDRNNQSEESVKEMQKINRFYELLEQEFDRKEGKGGLFNENIPEEPNADTTEADPDEPGISDEERKRRRKVQKKQRQRAQQREKKEQERREEEFERRREEMEEEMHRRREEMEEVMHREWEEARRKMEEFQKKQKETKQQNKSKFYNSSLNTKKGRMKAHQTWKSKIEALEKEEEGTNNGSSQMGARSKPPNSIMECSTDDIAIALRLGATDVAIELVQESMAECMQQSLRDRARKGEMIGTFPYLAEEDTLKFNYEVYVNVLQSRLDADGNHALHYAVYYEDNEFLTYLTHQAHRLGYFGEYVTSTSKHGSKVLDFCVGSSNPGFDNRVKAFYEEGCKMMQEKEEAEARSSSVILSSRYYFQQLRQHANLDPAFFSVFGILLGKYIFCGRWYETILAILFSRFMEIAKDASKHEQYYVLIFSHCYWFIFKSTVYFTWKLFPWWLILGVTLVAGYFFSLSEVIFFVPAMAHHGSSIIVKHALNLFGYFVPTPKSPRLALMKDVIVMCSCILLLRYAWSLLPKWNCVESWKEEANSEEL
ncbi:unnamed protein product [Cylindrotheca closterium]|uniref:J domain-containing protein n=1 Tax=Cylindrotheca closterium TaxID=2856 RepID=A0AAD2CT88_9STRA|nr:unnamed protein product [Cylindrotheca closterium]